MRTKHAPVWHSCQLALRAFLTIVCLLCSVPSARSQVLRDALWVTDGDVRAIQPVGDTIYIAGDFRLVGPATGHGVLLNRSTGGITWTFPEVDGPIYAAIPDSLGGW